MRAPVHGVTETLKEKSVAKALHDYCEKGKSIKLSEMQPFNENLESSADKGYCDRLK